MTQTRGPSDSDRTHLTPEEAASAPTLAGETPTQDRSEGSLPPPVDPRDRDLSGGDPPDRYRSMSLLGRGGMGEVTLCLDDRIGRQVAMKVIRAGRGSRSDAHQRFLREARVQAQLEHPAVVPVYDLGRHPDGQVYFTMKRIRGVALDELLARMRRGERPEGMSLRRILTAFSQVCLAIDYAHERGVLHRDLKPANVMIGDYGEVYVLDWGLAKVEGAAEPQSPAVDLEDTEATADGEILGTPGYIAPEQLRGEADARSDVYALGAILFEILTLQRLHEGKTPHALLVSTMEGENDPPSLRAPDRDIAPELDAICVHATALASEERFGSARALHDAIERYLDGDRDLALRRARAAEHAAAALAARDRVLQGDDGFRAAAMREVGRTLGLDPDNRDALQVLATLLETPPARIPVEAAETLQRVQLEYRRGAARNGAYGFMSGLLYLPLVIALGLRDVVPLAVANTLMIVTAIISFAAAAFPRRLAQLDVAAACFGTAALATLYPLFGPYLMLPTVLMGQVVAFSLLPDRRLRRISLVISCLGLAIPAGLDQLGWYGPTTTFETTALTIHPNLAYFPPGLTPLVILAISMGVMITSALLVGRARDAWTAAEERSQIQAWHLRQMVTAPTAPETAPPHLENVGGCA